MIKIEGDLAFNPKMHLIKLKSMVKLNLESQAQQKLRQLLGVQYDFLGFTINLETDTLTDNICSNSWRDLAVKLIAPMLSHYAVGTQAPRTGKLVKFRDIPGGYAYEGAFINRAIKPIEQAFGDTPRKLPQAAKLLGGKQLGLGDASTEIPALKGIPLTYIVNAAEEYPASANILYDESASRFLPTEDLAVLGELATMRLIEAKELLSKE